MSNTAPKSAQNAVHGSVLSKIMEELDVVRQQSAKTTAQAMRDLGWGKSRLTDLIAAPSPLTIDDLLHLLDAFGEDRLEFLERIHGKTEWSKQSDSVRASLESMGEQLAEMSSELGEDGAPAARLMLWAARSLLRVLSEGLRGGGSTQRVEAAMVELLGVALAVSEAGLGERVPAKPP